jgi:hypothetical protein
VPRLSEDYYLFGVTSITQLRGRSTYLIDKIIKAKGHPFYPNRLVRSTRLSNRRYGDVASVEEVKIVLKMTNVAFACHNEGSDTRNANIATP